MLDILLSSLYFALRLIPWSFFHFSAKLIQYYFHLHRPNIIQSYIHPARVQFTGWHGKCIVTIQVSIRVRVSHGQQQGQGQDRVKVRVLLLVILYCPLVHGNDTNGQGQCYGQGQHQNKLVGELRPISLLAASNLHSSPCIQSPKTSAWFPLSNN